MLDLLIDLLKSVFSDVVAGQINSHVIPVLVPLLILYVGAIGRTFRHTLKFGARLAIAWGRYLAKDITLVFTTWRSSPLWLKAITGLWAGLYLTWIVLDNSAPPELEMVVVLLSLGVLGWWVVQSGYKRITAALVKFRR